MKKIWLNISNSVTYRSVVCEYETKIRNGNCLFVFSVYFDAVDDDVVEKLLELTSISDRTDDAKAEFSLKSISGLLYKQQQLTNDMDNNIVDSYDICDDADEHWMLPAATAAVVSSTTDFCCETPNTERLLNISVPTLSFAAPYYCIPTVPVLSPCAASVDRGRGLDEHVCNTMGQNVCCDGGDLITKTDKSTTVSLADSQSRPLTSNNIQSTSICLQTSLVNVWPSYSSTALPSVPSLSPSHPILTSDHGQKLKPTIHSEDNCKTSTMITAAVSRVCELLAAQCSVLVLMRGCPGSGKTTMAMYVPFVVASKK